MGSTENKKKQLSSDTTWEAQKLKKKLSSDTTWEAQKIKNPTFL
jgi:hypothetical protein